MTNEPPPVNQDEFPSDLTGHFWATSEFLSKIDRWTFKVFDYQNNVLLSGVACSKRQAAAFVNAWDRVIVASGDFEDPSMDWPDERESLRAGCSPIKNPTPDRHRSLTESATQSCAWPTALPSAQGQTRRTPGPHRHTARTPPRGATDATGPPSRPDVSTTAVRPGPRLGKVIPPSDQVVPRNWFVLAQSSARERHNQRATPQAVELHEQCAQRQGTLRRAHTVVGAVTTTDLSSALCVVRRARSRPGTWCLSGQCARRRGLAMSALPPAIRRTSPPAATQLGVSASWHGVNAPP